MTTELEKALREIKSQFGDIVARLDKNEPVRVVSTGSLSLDRAIGAGGFPRGKLSTVFGPNSGGKTTLCLCSAGRCLEDGGTVVYVDVEQGGSERYAIDVVSATSGIDSQSFIDDGKLIVLRPRTGEEAMDAMKVLVPHVDLMIVDSISALMSEAELNSDTGSAAIGLRARFQTREFNKINPVLGQSECALVAISQVRANIGGYGSSETTTEPYQLRHLAALRIRISKASGIHMVSGKPYSVLAKAKVRKNKVGAPGSEAEFEIIFGKGINQAYDVLQACVEDGVIRRGGAYYYYPADVEDDQCLMRVNGKKEAVKWITENRQTMGEMRKALLFAE